MTSNRFEPTSDGPLRGRRIVVTRARAQAGEFIELLRASGAEVVLCPMIEVGPPESWESLDWVIHNLDSYHWLVFTSTNGVEFFFQRLLEKGKDARALGSARIAAVGDVTARALRNFGIVPNLVPEKFTAMAMLPSMGENQSGVRTAIVRAAKGRAELVDELRKRGGTVDLGIAYATREAHEETAEVRRLIADDAIDAITFTSGSTATNFFAMLSPEERAKVAASVCIASIGPSTSATIRALGMKVSVEAEESTTAGLRDALASWFARLSS